MFAEKQKCFTFASASYMVVVAQLVRASVCGTEGRRFEPGLPPKIKGLFFRPFFVLIYLYLNNDDSFSDFIQYLHLVI